ncbi:MAG: hypothetical protein MZV63_49110 [Marinilabiliales bacterium]|nr:hypothetical protein [Marinilabiliales bacterium]
MTETDNYLKDHQGLVGLHASFTVGDDDPGQGRGADEEDIIPEFISMLPRMTTTRSRCLSEHGRRVVERLSEAGVHELLKEHPCALPSS